MKKNIELIRLLAVILITFTHTRHNLTDADGLLFTVVELIPKVGTLLLSIISGYLFIQKANQRTTIIDRKVKSLVVPYLIANGVVLTLVLLANYILNLNFLNRLTYDYTLLTNGLLALNAEPINPPTYFIRDIFVIFVLIELVYYRNWKMLFFLLPLVIFGKLLLRYDILVLFILGCGIGYWEDMIHKHIRWIAPTLLVVTIICVCFTVFSIYRYMIAFAIFIPLILIDIRFPTTGGFSYLLHLYHSPIIVVSAPFIAKYVSSPLPFIGLQLLTVSIGVSLLYVLTRYVPQLRILSGGR